MIKVYGLKNCDTCRKATKWMTAEGIEHAFFDLRQDGIEVSRIEAWTAAVGWETLLNRKSTTWRGLDEGAKNNIDEAAAVALMSEHPALIKRPVFEKGSDVSVGFKEADKAILRS